MDDFGVDLNGLDDLLGKLKAVDEDVKYKGGRFALRKAANILRDQIKKNASRIDDPDTSESIEKNVAVRWSGKAFKRTGNLMFRVGILGGAKEQNKVANKPGGATFHWRFLEFGTSSQAPKPIVRPAAAKSQEAANEFTGQYSKAIERALKRAKK